MNVQSIRVSRDRELILSANQHLEQIYFEQENACIALSISRNYQILVENCVDIAKKISGRGKRSFGGSCIEEKNMQR
jgi:uncharacterized protein YutE (UPF0331/DUF86 family)